MIQKGNYEILTKPRMRAIQPDLVYPSSDIPRSRRRSLLMPESIISHAGKNLITYEITLYVRVAERLLDGHQMEVSLLLICRTSYCCTNSYPAIFFLILFLTIQKKYQICESVRQGDESGNLHHMVGIIWMSTSHVQCLTLVRRTKSTIVRYIRTFVGYISRRFTTLAPTNEESAWAQ